MGIYFVSTLQAPFIHKNTFEIKPELKGPSLTPIFLTGLDVVYNANHKAIWDSFCNNRKPNQLPINFIIQPLDHNYPKPHTKRINYEWYIPKGILKRNWFSKHQTLIPSVVVFFYELDWDDGSWDEKKLECGTRLNILKESLQNRLTKIIVVLIQSKSHFPPGEDMLSTEKAADFCSTCNVLSKHLFILPFSDLFYGYTLKLEGAFYEIAQTYYTEKIKNIKSHASYLNKNLHQALIVRYNVKAGFFNEMKQDLNLALKCYIQAYDCLAEMRVPENNLFEVKVVAGYITYKVCSLYFDKTSPLEAITHFNKHIELYKNKIGCPDLSFEHHAWLEAQYTYFGELFQNAVAAGLVAIQTQHPGYYYVQAAQETYQRRNLIRSNFQNFETLPSYPMPDPLQGQEEVEYYGQRAWKQGNLNTEHFDLNKERMGILALQLREWATDYASIIIALFKNSLPQFEQQRSPRLKSYLLMRISLELYDSGDYAGCLGIANTLVKEYRRDGWWLLFTNALQIALKCSYLLVDVPSFLTYCMDLIGAKSCLTPQEKRLHQLNFTRVLHCLVPDPTFLGLKSDPATLAQTHASWESSLLNYIFTPSNQLETNHGLPKIIIKMNENSEAFYKVSVNMKFGADMRFYVTLASASDWKSDAVNSSESLDLACLNSAKLFYTVFPQKPSTQTEGDQLSKSSHDFYYDFCTGKSHFNTLKSNNSSDKNDTNVNDVGGDGGPLAQFTSDVRDALLGTTQNNMGRIMMNPTFSHTVALPIPPLIDEELLSRGGEVRLNGLIFELAVAVEDRLQATSKFMVYLKWALTKTTPLPLGVVANEPIATPAAVINAITIPPRSHPIYNSVEVELGLRQNSCLLTDEIFEMRLVIRCTQPQMHLNISSSKFRFQYSDLQIDLRAIVNPIDQTALAHPVLPGNVLTSLSVGNKIDPSPPVPIFGSFKDGDQRGIDRDVALYMTQDKAILHQHCTRIKDKILGIENKSACLGDDKFGNQILPNAGKIPVAEEFGVLDCTRSVVEIPFYAILIKSHPDTVSCCTRGDSNLNGASHHFTIQATVLCKGRVLVDEDNTGGDNTDKDVALQIKNCVFQGLSKPMICFDPFVIKPYLMTHLQLKPLAGFNHFPSGLNVPPSIGGHDGDCTLTAPTFVLSLDLTTNAITDFLVESYSLIKHSHSVVEPIFDGLNSSEPKDYQLHLGSKERLNLSFVMAVQSKYLSKVQLSITTLGWLVINWVRSLTSGDYTQTSLYQIISSNLENSLESVSTVPLPPSMKYDNSCPVVLNLRIQIIPTPTSGTPPHWYRVHDTLKLTYTLTNTSPTQILSGRMAMGNESEDEEQPSFFIFAGCKQRSSPFKIMPDGGTYKFIYNVIPVHLGKQRLPKMAVKIDDFPKLSKYALLENTVPYVYIYPSNHIGHARESLENPVE